MARSSISPLSLKDTGSVADLCRVRKDPRREKATHTSREQKGGTVLFQTTSVRVIAMIYRHPGFFKFLPVHNLSTRLSYRERETARSDGTVLILLFFSFFEKACEIAFLLVEREQHCRQMRASAVINISLRLIYHITRFPFLSTTKKSMNPRAKTPNDTSNDSDHRPGNQGPFQGPNLQFQPAIFKRSRAHRKSIGVRNIIVVRGTSLRDSPPLTLSREIPEIRIASTMLLDSDERDYSPERERTALAKQDVLGQIRSEILYDSRKKV